MQLFPIHFGDEWWGFVGFDDCRTPREWDESEVSLLRTASEMIGSTLQRWQAEAGLRQARDDGRDETRGVVVAVNQPQAAQPSIDSFTVDQNQISAGQCVTLRWSTRNVPSALMLKRGDAFLLQDAPPSGTFSDCPPSAGLMTYTLVAAGEGPGDTIVSQLVTVDVKPN